MSTHLLSLIFQAEIQNLRSKAMKSILEPGVCRGSETYGWLLCHSQHSPQTTKQACPHEMRGHRPPGVSAVVTSAQKGASCSFELKVCTCTNSHISMYFPLWNPSQHLSDNLSCCHNITQCPGPRHRRGLKREGRALPANYTIRPCLHYQREAAQIT